MRAPLTLPALLALALLATAPAASALTLQTSKSPADDADLSDPNSLPQNNLTNQRSEDSGSTFHIGNSTLHFGISNGANTNNYGGNQWFLESPASRMVPSQMR
jgi:hypothetical protein